MTTINDIKVIIMDKTEKLLSLHLDLFIKTNKFSSYQVGKLIGKIINDEIKNFRISTKEKEKELKIVINKDYKSFMRETIDKLKIENEFLKKKRNILEIFQEANNRFNYEKLK